MINVYFSELPKTLTEILELKYDETMSYEERVQKRYDYIREQYELDNKYEGWDYLENVKYGLKFELLTTFEYMISTKGRVLTLYKQHDQYKVLKGGVSKRGYKHQAFIIGGNTHNFKVHRILASTFIPRDEHQVLKVNKLFVNHKDLKRLNNHISNLEWCTNTENLHHARLNGAWINKNVFFDKYLKATWIIDDKYKGLEFRVRNFSKLTTLGLNNEIVYNVLKGRRSNTMGCNWMVITEQEYNELPDVPEFILDKILNDPAYINPHTNPIKVTIVKDGIYKGDTFVVYGNKELISYGFERNRFLRAIAAKKEAYGCAWERINRSMAEDLQRGPTPEQIDHLGLRSKLKN